MNMTTKKHFWILGILMLSALQMAWGYPPNMDGIPLNPNPSGQNAKDSNEKTKESKQLENSFLIGEPTTVGAVHMLPIFNESGPGIIHLNGLKNGSVVDVVFAPETNSYGFIIEGIMSNDAPISIMLYNSIGMNSATVGQDITHMATQINQALNGSNDDIQLMDIKYYSNGGYYDLQRSKQLFYGEITYNVTSEFTKHIGKMTQGMKHYEFSLGQLYFDETTKSYRINVWGKDWTIAPQNKESLEALHFLMDDKKSFEEKIAAYELGNLDLPSTIKINLYGFDDEDATIYLLDAEEFHRINVDSQG